MNTDVLWPDYEGPADVARIEETPLAERGLPATTAELLTRAARQWPDDVAVSVLPGAEQWTTPAERTFAELAADVHRAANLLHALGVRRTTGVAIMSPNCADLLTATLAAQLAGIAVPLNAALAGSHVRRLLELTGARTLLCASPELDQAAWGTVRELDADGLLDTVLLLRPTGRQTVEVPEGLTARTLVLADAAAEHPADRFAGTAPAADDLAAVFHTGGTTGTPKLAAHTHANEVTDAWMIAADSGNVAGAAVFAALPLFHVNALVVTVLAPLFRGQPVVWAGPLGYRDQALFPSFWKIVEHHRITMMVGVPTVYGALAQVPVDADISSLRLAVVGAAPLPPSVRAVFAGRTGLDLLDAYGLTEATCATTRSFPGSVRPGTVGQRMPYQKVRTVRIGADGTWTDQPPGETGILVVSGPTVFPGYVVGRADEGLVLDPLGKVVDGWLDTGDLARIDDDGFVHLAGREKDLIIRGGHNIDPAAIEDTLMTHPGVAAASVVGEPDAHAGEVPVAFVVLRPGAATTAEEVRDWAARHIQERGAAPRRVTAVDVLPMTAVGKPFKPALRALAVRQAVTEALVGVAAPVDVAAVPADGTVKVTVSVATPQDGKTVSETLGRFSLDWTCVVSEP
jgi:fatty-acyl-CoA synthase